MNPPLFFPLLQQNTFPIGIITFLYRKRGIRRPNVGKLRSHFHLVWSLETIKWGERALLAWKMPNQIVCFFIVILARRDTHVVQQEGKIKWNINHLGYRCLEWGGYNKPPLRWVVSTVTHTIFHIILAWYSPGPTFRSLPSFIFP